MQLIQPRFLSALLLLAAAACGADVAMTSEAESDTKEQPEPTWMLGVWSNESPGWTRNICDVSHLKIEEEGKVFKGYAGGDNCLDGPMYPTKLTWEHDGQDAIIVHLPEGGYYDGWRITLAMDDDTGLVRCDKLDVYNILNGVPEEKTRIWYIRGAVCFKNAVPLEGTDHYDPWETTWCDGPPPPCEGAP